MAWSFRVGQKVVCVDDGLSRGGVDFKAHYGLKAGKIYMLRWVGHYEWLNAPAGVGVRLEEIYRKDRRTGEVHDTPFGAERFRPLVTDTQSWLREILEKPPENTRDLEHVGAGGLR